MMTFRFLSTVLLFVSLFATAQGDVLIDRFNFGNSGSVPRSFSNVNTYGVFTSTQPGSGSTILDGVRKWQVTVTKHSIGRTEIYDVASGMYSVANGFGQNAEVAIRWDGTDNGLMSGDFASLDLTQGSANSMLALDVGFADVATQFEVEVSDSTGTFGVTKVATHAKRVNFLFNDFTGIDFTDVRSIQLLIFGGDAYDVALDNFAAVAIPEPATVTLWCVGLSGLFFARRRRRTS